MGMEHTAWVSRYAATNLAHSQHTFALRAHTKFPAAVCGLTARSQARRTPARDSSGVSLAVCLMKRLTPR